MIDSVNEIINHKGVCRTALATLGLFKRKLGKGQIRNVNKNLQTACNLVKSKTK